MIWALTVLLTLAIVAPSAVARLGRRALAIFALAPAAIVAFLAWQIPAILGGSDYREHVVWVPQLGLTIDLRIDGLSALMALVVTVIGTAVLWYSVRYFPPGDDGLPKYSGSLLAFAAAMLGLVLADNLIFLLVCWELTGILSYLLIAHRVRRLPSRRAATQSLMVTAAGGMAMLVGAVLLGVEAGTFTISDILESPPSGSATTVAVILLLVGGISKSAIVPFHFWLPGAMAAPTPASAYLHAATMVKAGVYLFARFTPLLNGIPSMRPALVGLGAVTMVLAGLWALRQRDLKLLLAYGTVSQLGLLTLVIGTGTPMAMVAGLGLLAAHSLFKAALFFIVGIIDNATGTRDLTELTGLARRMPLVAAMAIIAASSMAGLPLTIGFVAKEAAFETLLAGDGFAVWTAVAMLIGSVLTVAYSMRLLWGAFATKPGVPLLELNPRSSWMTLPTVILVAASVVLGLWPQPLEKLLTPYAQTMGAAEVGALQPWHGWGTALIFSLIALIVGLLVFQFQRSRERRRQAFTAQAAEAGGVYRALLRGIDRGAIAITNSTQRGSLPVSLGAIIAVLIVFPGVSLLTYRLSPGGFVIAGSVPQAILALAALVLALAVLRIRYAVAAILAVSGIGYAIAIWYVLRGAPDLALTQILVETVTLIVAVLVVVRMPDKQLWTPQRGAMARTVRISLAVGAGLLMTVLALMMPGQRVDRPISDGLIANAYVQGGGRNAVNIILVDVRGWDTFGEISVLVAAAIGVSSLIFLGNPRMSRFRRTSHTSLAPPVVAQSSPWLATNVVARHSLLLEVATRLVFHLIVIFSLYVLFVGHDEPGGGFAGGLIAGIALALRYLAGGRYELAEAAPLDAGVVTGIGLATAALTATAGFIFGSAALQSTIFSLQVPLVGELTLVSSTIFDIGVYLVVVGVLLEILRSVGAELDRQAVTP